MKEKPQPPVKLERPRRDTDHPESHCSHATNLKREQEAKVEENDYRDAFYEGWNSLNIGS